MLWRREANTGPFLRIWDACCRECKQAGAHKADWGIRMCCNGDSLQEQCTRCDIENSSPFVPAPWHTNSEELNFMRNVAREKSLFLEQNFISKNMHLTRREKLLLQHVPTSWPHNISSGVCQSYTLGLTYGVLSKLSKCIIIRWWTTQSGISQWFVYYFIMLPIEMAKGEC